MKNVVLTGFMGTGKTTVGKILAKKLGCRFVDTDEEIVRAEGKSINELFELYGEGGFRDIESRVIATLSEKKNCVIATGGGAVLRKENMDNLRKKGIIILLRADIDTIAQRLTDSSSRPLANGQTREALAARLESRRVYYDNHDFAFDIHGESPMRIADKILDICKKL